MRTTGMLGWYLSFCQRKKFNKYYSICLDMSLPWLYNRAILYFAKEYRTLEKQYDVSRMHTYLPTPPAVVEGETVTLSLENKQESQVDVRVVLRKQPTAALLSHRGLPEDCWRLVAAFAEEYVDVRVQLDMCVSSPPPYIYYAYPFHPFVWKLRSVETNRDCVVPPWYLMQSKVLYHNRIHTHESLEEDVFSFYELVEPALFSVLRR